MSTFERVREIPRNIWAVSLTSFLTDISSEMVVYLLPLFLVNVLGVRIGIVGLIEGVAEATASLLKLFSGWFSDRVGGRKWVAVTGYAISAFSKPFYYFAGSARIVASVRWADRVGKGIRTAPRDALVADSVAPEQRGIAFGFHRAADTAGAVVGLLIALLVVWFTQSGALSLDKSTFQTLVLISLIPAFMGVLALVVMARDVPVMEQRAAPKFRLKGLGRPFLTFLFIIAIFELGNASDAFLILRAQERGLSVAGILVLILVFNLVYALISTPAGSLSDRIGRRRLLIAGFLLYAGVYLGFAFVQESWHVFLLYIFYGIYYGLTSGTAKAVVADIVPDILRGTAYGSYNAVLGIMDLPASLLAGILWQGVGSWQGFGPAAPFFFGCMLALLAAILMFLWRPTGVK